MTSGNATGPADWDDLPDGLVVADERGSVVVFNTAAARAWRAQGIQVLAADGYGDTDLDDCIDDGTLAKPTAWLFGNEAHGLPDGINAIADHSVKVPIYGRAESLNLATAAAVCLYASARAQRRTARWRRPRPGRPGRAAPARQRAGGRDTARSSCPSSSPHGRRPG